MSESFIGDAVSAETEGRPVVAAPDQNGENWSTTNSLIDSPDTVATPGPTQSNVALLKQPRASAGRNKSKRNSQKTKPQIPPPAVKQRFGLPDGFVPRWQRYDRSILLEQNIYRLPNGNEFVPAHPSGTLGGHQHLYALLSVEQYLNDRRGSVYVRNDDRIFDYSVDSNIPNGDIFDTGYTIYDLERTGRYAPAEKSKKRKREAANRKAASAS